MATGVRLDLSGMRKLRAQGRAGSAMMNGMLDDIAFILLAYWRERFVENSRGGGGWKPLLPATVKRKTAKGGRKGQAAAVVKQAKTGGATAILIDTGQMKNALTPQTGLKRKRGLHIHVGFRPARAEGGQLTLAQLADIHHRGIGNVPARPILVKPTRPVVRRLQEAVRRRVQLAMKQAEVKRT